MRKLLVILAAVFTLTVANVALATAAHAKPDTQPGPATDDGWRVLAYPDGSLACSANDRIAASGPYYATEKTCVEVNGGKFRAHGVTRCWKSGVLYPCYSINGDTVVTHLYLDDPAVPNDVLPPQVVAGTQGGDDDCRDCKENSHYSVLYCNNGFGSSVYLQGREDNLRVAFQNGVISIDHKHASPWTSRIWVTCP
jgi:hypothetical protein